MEIFRLLCVKAGAKLSQRQVAKLLKVSPTAVAKALPLLKNARMAKVEKGNNLNLVELDRDSRKTLELKRAENLRLLIESGLPEFLEGSLPGATIVLFGSYAKGDDTVTSDIDIAAIGISGKKIILDEYGKRLEKEIRINYFRDFKALGVHMKSSICNGIVLSGGIEL